MEELIELEQQTGLSRRSVLKGLVALGLVPSVALGCGEILQDLIDAINNRPTRQNVSSLSATDDTILAYEDAITQMQALPSTDLRNWNNIADVHLNSCPHSNWLFLPWHRLYMFYLEKTVRDLSGMTDWALPYWNWIEDPTIPAMFQSGVLSHPRSSQSVTVQGSVADTAMGHTSFINFGSGALSAGDGQRTSATKSDFESNVHDPVHVQIGNFTDGMGSFRSPLDPIFWLHHNMIEYMWVEWNLGRGNDNPSDAVWTDFEFTNDFADETGTAVAGTESGVSFSLLFPLLSYQFENSLVGTVAGTI